MLGTDNCLEFILHRVSPCGDYLPVMIWFHDRWTVFDDVRGALRLYDGASLARARMFTLVAAQYHLRVLRFIVLRSEGQSTQNQQSDQVGFGDQHVFMRWLQDNAAGIDLNKTSAVLFGHGVGSWSLCYHVLETTPDSQESLFSAVIMQSGFCDDIQDTWNVS